MATSTLGSGTLVLAGTTSGTTTVTATAVAGTTTLTLPAATDTLVGKATTDTLTNKTLTGAVMNGTLGATTPSTVAATTISASSTATFAAGAAGTPSITTTGDTNTGIFFPAADTIAFAEGGAEVARFDSSGNFGLGVTPSAWQVNNRAIQLLEGYASISSNNSQGCCDVAFNCFNAGSAATSGWKYTNTGVAVSLFQQQAGAFKFLTAASGTAGNAITFTQAMTLDASGRLGIGTTSPNNTLDVVSSGDVARFGNTKKLYVSTDSSGYGLFSAAGQTGTGLYVSDTSSFMYFATGSSERARIDNSGNLLVGTTNPAIDTGVGIKFLNDTNKHISAVSSSSTNAGGETFVMYSTTAAAYRFYVGWGGTIFATSITITAISDQRLKENVRVIDTGLSSIMALKPRRFDWKEGKGQDKKNVAGFIAQEFEDVFPECVSTSMAGEDGIEYKNINHETLIPTLVKAIQEQQALITTLTARITALESA